MVGHCVNNSHIKTRPFLDLYRRWTPASQSPGIVGASADQPQSLEYDPTSTIGVAAPNYHIFDACPSQVASSSKHQLDHNTYPLNFPPNAQVQLPLLSGAVAERLQALRYGHDLLSVTVPNKCAYNASTSPSASSPQRQLDYFPNVQSDLPTGSSYDSTLRPGSPPIGNGLLMRSSIDNRPNSPGQLVDPAASPSTSQSTPNAEPVTSQTMTPTPQPASSTSRSPADDSKALEEENKMRKEMMMGVFALNSRKRKRGESPMRLPDVPGVSDGPTNDLQPKPKRKKKESLSTPNAALPDATGGVDMMNGREHARKASLRDHCRQASMQIDHLNARNVWLENELHRLQTESDNQVRAAAVNYQQRNQEDRQKILAMTSEQVDLRNQINNLEWAGRHQRYLLATKEQTIVELQMKLRACQWRLTQTQGQIQT